MPAPDEDEDKTRIMRKPAPAAASDDTGETDRTDRPKRPIPAGPLPPTVPGDEEEGAMTRLVRPNRGAVKSETPTAPETGDAADPVVGWLVVLAGPGRGHSVNLGYGQNSIGRDHDERCSFDFGDPSISRKKHCFVIYEPRQRQYILRPGDGANLTYLKGKLVSEPKPLVDGDLIELGKTTLRFVAFCGKDFDWQDQPETSPKA